MMEQFSVKQQLTIYLAPEWVGAAVGAAGQSGLLGTLREDAAIRKIMKAEGEKHPNNLIIQTIVSQLGMRGPEMDLAYREQHWELRQRYKSDGAINSDVLADFSLKILQDALNLLAGAFDQRDVREYKRWVLDVGQGVAEVASEGGFLGLGGERVSQAEKDFLERVGAVHARP